MTNILGMEKDWIPMLANTEDGDHGSIHLNTAMRRIDVMRKFLAPLAISSVVALVQPAPAAIVIATVSALGVLLEAWMALKVWKQNSRIQAVKRRRYDREETLELGTSSTSRTAVERLSASVLQIPITKFRQGLKHSRDLIQAGVDGIRYYFSKASQCTFLLDGNHRCQGYRFYIRGRQHSGVPMGGRNIIIRKPTA